MEALTPNIFVKDINETIQFYEQLGFKTFESLGSELPAISRQDGGSLLLYIQTKEVRAFHDNNKYSG